LTHTPPTPPSDDEPAEAPHRPAVPTAALAALGIVFGDLGTSPLYTLQTIVASTGGHFTPGAALAILSLIIWTLIITISVKYCVFVLRADNRGEGGILALMSLVGADSLKGRMAVMTAMGLLGAALIYGDGVITPAISVLSALEGVNVVTSTLKPFVMPLAVVILVVLFVVQRFGTATIGRAFGPIMLVWFVVIAVLGIGGVVSHPAVLRALNPLVGLSYLSHGNLETCALILGGVFLCITGGEALYADMGHIGRFPIRMAWFVVVLPALLINYAGQTALLMEKTTFTSNPFFLLAPTWAIYPLVALSTVATIIASQAIITGSFSMTRQAMQLGWMPGVNIRQTSDKTYGQIYVPVVNWLMMVATVGITVTFASSDRLAGAYGTAVSTTMLLTTGLLLAAMRTVWKWPPLVAYGIAGLFLIVDLAFFSANLLKIVDGGWLPLTLGLLVFIVMTTWREGVDGVRKALGRKSATRSDLHKALTDIPRVPGTAVFLTRATSGVPSIIVDHIRYMGALQKVVVALTIVFEHRPRVPEAKRATIDVMGDGLCRVTMRFGFVEKPDLTACLEAIKDRLDGVDVDGAIFFSTRDMVAARKREPHLPAWRRPLFGFMYRNSVKVVDRFNLPEGRVVEVARQLEI
jgi:KUP system potassium uptake protein